MFRKDIRLMAFVASAMFWGSGYAADNSVYIDQTGDNSTITMTQDGSGNRGVTLGGKFVIPSSATSPLPWSTAANKMDILAATYHSGRDKWDVVAFVPGY